MTERAANKNGTLSDGELLNRLFERDSAALEILYDRYSGYVYALTLKMMGSTREAEEITQDVFWQLWKNRIQYDPERGRFSTWLFAITRNRCLDRLRSMQRKPHIQSLVEHSPEPQKQDVEENIYAAERRQIVQQALNLLPDPQRQALELAYYQGMTHSEIAGQLEVPLGTVKSRIKLGMQKLKQKLRNIESNDI